MPHPEKSGSLVEFQELIVRVVSAANTIQECLLGNERASIRHNGTLIDEPNPAWIVSFARGGETFGVDWRGVQLITGMSNPSKPAQCEPTMRR